MHAADARCAASCSASTPCSASYKAHPDQRQEQLFFALLKEAVRRASSIEALLKEHMRENHVRHDAFEVMERTPPLEQVLPKAA